jgi:succinyl-CoA synthetase alpha subunit
MDTLENGIDCVVVISANVPAIEDTRVVPV